MQTARTLDATLLIVPQCPRSKSQHTDRWLPSSNPTGADNPAGYNTRGG